MKKSILTLGKVLNKTDQKQINGGGGLVVCSMEVGGCPCNCWWDEEGKCVTDPNAFTTPCD
ncbi:hypothetical protein KUL118_51820 [Tenacibaculum sp. KUL118]|nr:hypothetical protein KUL118_51820 [Tenacibaculum sp. KUL118]